MELSITPSSASVSPPKKWEKPHTPFSEVTTPPRLSAEQRDLRPSKTSLTGSEPGLSKDKAWLMALSQCRNLEKTQVTRLSSIQAVLSSPSPQMYLRRFELNGQLAFLSLTASLIKLSATLPSPANKFPKRWSLLVSKWAISFSKLTQNSTCTNQTRESATSWSTSADYPERTRTCSS